MVASASRRSARVGAWASRRSSKSDAAEHPKPHRSLSEGASVGGGGSEDEVGQAVAVPVAGAEEVLRRIGAADVEVEVVLPRVADATMDLDGVLGVELGRLARHHL